MDVPKTLDEIRAVKGVFPADEIEPGDSVLDLMCAGFYGANAAIHVIDRKPSRYVGVDIDGAKLDAMRAIYPADVCEFENQLAEDAGACFLIAAKRFDVVICDPWTQGIASWMTRLRVLKMITRKRLILGTCDSWLKAHGMESTPMDMTAWACRETVRSPIGGVQPIACARVIRRSDHLGGTFWTVWR